MSTTKTIDVEIYEKLPAYIAGDECVIFGHQNIPAYTIAKIARTQPLDTKSVAVTIAGITYIVDSGLLFTRRFTKPTMPIKTKSPEEAGKKPSTNKVTVTPKIPKIPMGMRKATYFTKGSAIAVYGSPDHKDGTVGSIHVYMQPTSKFISVLLAGKVEYIAPEFLYQKDPTYTEPGPLFKDFTESSELMKYMADLLYAQNMDDSITLALQDVDLKDYDMIASASGSRWAAIIPKNAKGPMPVLMAHCDIQYGVKHPTENNLEYDPKLEKFNSPTGLGADDRAGLFVINRALQLQPGKFIAIFFDEEEVGCRGSRNFVTSKDFKEKIDPLASTYISIDRTRAANGAKTVATYGHDNKELLKLFKEKSKRNDVKGSSTDCKILSAQSSILSKTSEGVSCVNFSCGYQFEHTVRETLYWKELLACAIDVAELPSKVPELWTKRFLAAKAPAYKPYSAPKKTKTAKNAGSPSWYGDDFILVNDEYYDEEDVKLLMKYYKRHTGVDYTLKTATPYEPKRQDFVRLSTDVSVGGVYGGKRLDRATHAMLAGNVWIVHSIDAGKSTANLMTDDDSYDAVNIPFIWLEAVTQTDPLISPSLLEGK